MTTGLMCVTVTTVLIGSVFLFPAVLSFQCLNHDGQVVDWYMTYKSPKMKDMSKTFYKGLAHYYLDVGNPTAWKLAKGSINDTTGNAVYTTLQQVYSSKDANMVYFMYNDERPGHGKNNLGGHTKGVVAFNGTTGFWLIHSVPKFPPPRSQGYAYPSNGERYGQSFLCLSLPLNMLGTVGQQLLYNEPHVYDYQLPQALADKFPVLQRVASRKWPQSPPWFSILPLQTVKGQTFTSFAKTTDYGRDLYKDLVAPKLKSNLLVETWMDGGGQLATNCSGMYKVLNVIRVSLPGGVLFKRSKDHSKWATSVQLPPVNGGDTTNTNTTWTCVGDINRMFTQYKRGGGTVCLNNSAVWKTFRNSVEKFEKCGKQQLNNYNNTTL